jgi:hypothetical protein
MELNTGIDWASHDAIIKFFTGEYLISMTLEHGTGMHSTPRLIHGSEHYIGYEENRDFMQQMIDDGIYTESDVHYLELPESVGLATKFSELNDTDKRTIINTYKLINDMVGDLELYKNAEGYNLLFVDGFTATRNVAINYLYHYFDIILYHDCEPLNGKESYEYDFEKEIVDRFDHYVVEMPFPHTGILIRKGISFDTDVLKEYLNDYCDTLGWDYEDVNIIKQ